MMMNIHKNSAVQEPPIEDKRYKPVYCAELNDWFPHAQVLADKIGVTRNMVYLACNGYTRTCAGFHVCYEEDVAKCKEMTRNHIGVLNADKARLVKENAKLKAERDSEKELADQMRAILAERKAEEERIRKAEQERLELIDHTKQAIESAKAEQERIKRILEALEEQYQRAKADLANAEQKEHDLTMQLLKLEGKIVEKED